MMPLKVIRLFAILMLAVLSSQAQQLVLQGKITYERKENMHKQLDEEGGSWAEMMKKQFPKYRTDEFQLAFTTHKSVYKLTKEEENRALQNSWWKTAWNNTVVADLEKQTEIEEKNIYENNYRIEDSIPAYKWKLSGEYREIAGYNCRRATTIIMDSIYVIAFYTDEIPVSAGPESFFGLPGMILGAVVPRLNYTFFATKVESQTITEKDFEYTPMKKTKKVNRAELFKEINDAVSDWGKYGRKIYWKVVL